MSPSPCTAVTVAGAFCVLGVLSSCTDGGRMSGALDAETPLHLEDHLEVVRITGSEAPAGLPRPVERSFDRPQPARRASAASR